ncbi:YciE/YciF ferroxidase family protein [Halegenticoccus soli]|uniref:YciE/YciF ferroxidase family protein n=1 Tax=Halegenticoccus soli TaxID=1985678 RepID=UPI00130424E0|nr:DUF892 family protein [Halegenticoccus soli]
MATGEGRTEIGSMDDLFEYELESVYYVENRLVGALDEMAAGAANDRIARAFADHRDETRTHVDRLETVFEKLDREPAEREVLAIDGMIEDRRRFEESVRDDDLRDVFYLGAGAKAERFEITSYRTMLEHADKLDLGNEVLKPLEDNLDEEEAALDDLHGMTRGTGIRGLIRRLTG